MERRGEGRGRAGGEGTPSLPKERVQVGGGRRGAPPLRPPRAIPGDLPLREEGGPVRPTSSPRPRRFGFPSWAALSEAGEGPAALGAPRPGARVQPVATEHPQRVAGRRAAVLGAGPLLRAGGGRGRGAGARLEHAQRVPAVVRAARVAPGPRGGEVQQRDLVPARQELRVRGRVGARQEGPLGPTQADEEAVLRRVVHVVAVLQRPLPEPAALGAEVMLKAGRGDRVRPKSSAGWMGPAPSRDPNSPTHSPRALPLTPSCPAEQK